MDAAESKRARTVHASLCRSTHPAQISSIAVATSAAIHLVAVLVPGLRPVFRTFPMTSTEWLVLLALSGLIIPAVEFAKIVYRKMYPDEVRA